MSRDYFILESVLMRLTCPCGAVNYYEDADFEDSSKVDAETLRCWRCHKAYWLAPTTKEVRELVDGEASLPNDNIADEDGLESPRSWTYKE